MKPILKIGLGAAALSVAVIFAYFQINEYFAERRVLSEQRIAIEASVAESSVGASEILSFEFRSMSVTYKEVIDKAADRVEKISQAIIPVGVSSLPPEEKNALIQYLSGLQELLRLQVARNRAEVKVNAEIKVSQQALDEVDPGYTRGYTLKRLEQLKKDFGEAVSEWKKAKQTFSEKVAYFNGRMPEVRKNLGRYTLIDSAVLTQLQSATKAAASDT